MKIKKLLSDHVQHLTVRGAKGTTFRYKEVKFLRSCKCLKSVYFKNSNVFSMYYCCHGDEEEDNQSVDQNLSFKSSIESVKASLGPEDIQFLHSDKFFESSIRRLNIISYENIISGRLCNYLLSFLLYVTFGFRGYCTMSNYDLGGQCELT